MKKFKKRYWITVIGLIIFYYLLNVGPLFPWNPWKSGYEEFKSQTYAVYTPQGTVMPTFYQSLDGYLTETSKQFDLPLTHPIKLIRVDKAHFKAYLPWMNTDALGGAALQTGDVLYVGFEKIAQQGLNEEEYVKHEVVHLMHHQNTNILNSAAGLKIEYLSEGVPFYAGGPRFYPREEFLERLKKVKLAETTSGDEIYTPETFSVLDEKTAEQYKVSHMLYGEFIKYLIDTYGQEKFNAFDHEFLKTPSLHRTIFEEQYGKKLEVVLQEFEEKLLPK
jgi:hypothetical protein